MSKKDFIALADMIREHNQLAVHNGDTMFDHNHIATLAEFCEQQNSQFNRSRWLAYIAGECGPNGGTIKKAA